MFKIMQLEQIDLAIEGFKIKSLITYIRKVHGPIRQEETVRDLCLQRLRSGVHQFFRQSSAHPRLEEEKSLEPKPLRPEGKRWSILSQ